MARLAKLKFRISNISTEGGSVIMPIGFLVEASRLPKMEILVMTELLKYIQNKGEFPDISNLEKATGLKKGWVTLYLSELNVRNFIDLDQKELATWVDYGHMRGKLN